MIKLKECWQLCFQAFSVGVRKCTLHPAPSNSALHKPWREAAPRQRSSWNLSRQVHGGCLSQQGQEPQGTHCSFNLLVTLHTQPELSLVQIALIVCVCLPGSWGSSKCSCSLALTIFCQNMSKLSSVCNSSRDHVGMWLLGKFSGSNWTNWTGGYIPDQGVPPLSVKCMNYRYVQQMVKSLFARHVGCQTGKHFLWSVSCISLDK